MSQIKIYFGLLTFSVFLAASYWESLKLKPASLVNGATFIPSECWFKSNVAIRYECGYLNTRTDNVNKVTYKLPVVVLRHSWWHNSDSSMLHLSGGPGGPAYLDSKAMYFQIQNFIEQDWEVDFVLYDQRGVGLSEPSLRCNNTNKSRLESLALDISARQEYMKFIDDSQACLSELTTSSQHKQHLKYIGTEHSVNDIADLHDLLGVKQWVLMGVSYGTRLALESARKIPKKIKSMVLDSVYPPQIDGFETLPENSFNAIQVMLDFCQNDDDCNDEYPELQKTFIAALVLLKQKPWYLKVPQDKANLPSRELVLTADRFVRLLSYASYDSSTLKDVPAAIFAIASHDKSNSSVMNLAKNLLEMELFEDFSEPVFMITECLENGGFDMTAFAKKLQVYQALYPVLKLSSSSIYDPRMCDGWRDISFAGKRNFRAQVSSDIPSLVLSGALDSVTPASWARLASTSLSNSIYIEYPNLAHAVLYSSLCANDEVQHFLNPSKKNTKFCNVKERLAARANSSLNWSY